MHHEWLLDTCCRITGSTGYHCYHGKVSQDFIPVPYVALFSHQEYLVQCLTQICINKPKISAFLFHNISCSHLDYFKYSTVHCRIISAIKVAEPLWLFSLYFSISHNNSLSFPLRCQSLLWQVAPEEITFYTGRTQRLRSLSNLDHLSVNEQVSELVVCVCVHTDINDGSDEVYVHGFSHILKWSFTKANLSLEENPAEINYITTTFWRNIQCLLRKTFNQYVLQWLFWWGKRKNYSFT